VRVGPHERGPPPRRPRGGRELNVKVSLVRELTRRGDLPAIQIGERYWRYRRESLLRWIEARERAGPP